MTRRPWPTTSCSAASSSPPSPTGWCRPRWRRTTRTTPATSGRCSRTRTLRRSTASTSKQAWALTKGSSAVTVAVIDTGILAHPDIASRLAPGYDMISNRRGRRRRWSRRQSVRMSATGTPRASAASAPARRRARSTACTSPGSSGRARTTASCMSGSTSKRADPGRSGARQVWREHHRHRRWHSLGRRPARRWGPHQPDAGTRAEPQPGRPWRVRRRTRRTRSTPRLRRVRSSWSPPETKTSDLDLNPVNPANCANVITVTAVDHLAYRSSFSNYGSTVDDRRARR